MAERQRCFVAAPRRVTRQEDSRHARRVIALAMLGEVSDRNPAEWVFRLHQKRSPFAYRIERVGQGGLLRDQIGDPAMDAINDIVLTGG